MDEPTPGGTRSLGPSDCQGKGALRGGASGLGSGLGGHSGLFSSQTQLSLWGVVANLSFRGRPSLGMLRSLLRRQLF